jgi:hypothetical protein
LSDPSGKNRFPGEKGKLLIPVRDQPRPIDEQDVARQELRLQVGRLDPC